MAPTKQQILDSLAGVPAPDGTPLTRTDALSDLKRALEGPTMSKPAFVYKTYITTIRLGASTITERFMRRWRGDPALP